MMNNLMLFIIMLGLFVQFAGENVPKILKDNKSLIMQLLWVMLFLGCFFGWKIDSPKAASSLKLNKSPETKPSAPKPPATRPPATRPPATGPPPATNRQQRTSSPPQMKRSGMPNPSGPVTEGYAPFSN